MKSDRSSRLYNTRNFNAKGKSSISPTLASSYSEKSLWAKSYKNQPFPSQLRRRLIGRKLNLTDFSDQEEENTGIVVEEDEQEVEKKKTKVLPHFKLISDNNQFIGHRSRIRSEINMKNVSLRCKSVESLKLPQVEEEKKEQDEFYKLERSKLSQFKDRNQFNQKNAKKSSSNHSDRSGCSVQMNHFSVMPEKIIQNQAEETKSEKLRNHDRSLQFYSLTSELEKLIVDEVDEKKKKKEEPTSEIESIIEEEKVEEENDNVNTLRISLNKLEIETEYLKHHHDEQIYEPQRHTETEKLNSLAEENNKNEE